MPSPKLRRVVIAGAAGRDFHNFNVVYRDDPSVEVVGFTAAQIPGIAGRRYPAALAGPRYPKGIRIVEEAALEALVARTQADEVVFAYSDVTHETVMHLASRALACGADFTLHGPRRTMLRSNRPVVAVCAARTGCGKSQTARYVAGSLRAMGLRVAVLRHPMPYGDLLAERVQRFATLADLESAHCTLEEREEYEGHIEAGDLVFAGVDYAAVLTAAEVEADVVVWDGGNNDFSFVRPDLAIAVVDALRPSQIATHHPGETVVRMADVVVVNKVDTTLFADTEKAVEGVRRINSTARLVLAASPITLEDPELVRDRRVLVVEDGPTITHGGMCYGAGYVAAMCAGASEVVDPRSVAAPGIAEVYRQYPHIGGVLPAVGYGDAQLRALEETLERADCDVVVSATPIDLRARLRTRKPIVRARYAYADAGEPTLRALLQEFVERQPNREALAGSVPA